MTTRPTPEQFLAIREMVEHFLVKDPDGPAWHIMKSLIAVIDALTVERDKYSFEANAFLEGAEEWEEDCKNMQRERDQWRAHAEKLREAMEDVRCLCTDRMCTCGYTEVREALAVKKPGE